MKERREGERKKEYKRSANIHKKRMKGRTRKEEE